MRCRLLWGLITFTSFYVPPSHNLPRRWGQGTSALGIEDSEEVGNGIVLTTEWVSLVPRPSPASGFDCLQYSKMGWEIASVYTLCMSAPSKIDWDRQTISQLIPLVSLSHRQRPRSCCHCSVPNYPYTSVCMLHPHIAWGGIKRRESIETCFLWGAVTHTSKYSYGLSESNYGQVYRNTWRSWLDQGIWSMVSTVPYEWGNPHSIISGFFGCSCVELLHICFR